MNDLQLNQIVLLFLDPEQIFFDGTVQLSPLLRKLYAQHSMTCNSHGAERGVKPTVREVRRAVVGARGRSMAMDGVAVARCGRTGTADGAQLAEGQPLLRQEMEGCSSALQARKISSTVRLL